MDRAGLAFHITRQRSLFLKTEKPQRRFVGLKISTLLFIGAVLRLCSIVKLMTRSEAETKRQKAVDFLRRIGQDDDADRFEAMDAGEYAEHKGAELLENPTRRQATMKRPKSRTDLEAELENANDYIEELETKLDSIAGIATGDEEDSEAESEDEDLD